MVVYACAIGSNLVIGGEKLNELPPLNPNMVWLIGISHAAYIAYKASPHSGASPTEGEGATVG